ncbi:MAG: hypothetical protein AAGG51_13370 [Cyanobacteria bacterium P01_G01_bin.54]
MPLKDAENRQHPYDVNVPVWSQTDTQRADTTGASFRACHHLMPEALRDKR